MNLSIVKAAPNDAEAALEFYYQLIDAMRGNGFLRWEKGVYPKLSDLQEAARAGNLYLGYWNKQIAGAFILSHNQDEGYSRVHWTRDVPAEKVAVVHLLAVRRDLKGLEIGTQLLREAVRIAKERGDEVVRMDTLTYNEPVQRLYEKFGFVCCGDVEIYYPTTGSVPFRMYEYVIR